MRWVVRKTMGGSNVRSSSLKTLRSSLTKPSNEQNHSELEGYFEMSIEGMWKIWIFWQATEELLTVGIFQDIDIIFKKISNIFIDMRKHQNDIFPEFSAE